MSRRGESIYKRKDGRWEARYIHHYENGKAKYRYIYAPTYTEVKAKRNEELRLQPRTSIPTVKQAAKFDDIASPWLAEIRTEVKESTFARYFRIASVYLLPKFGGVELKKMDIRYYSGYLLDKGGKNGSALSSKTVTDILCVLKAILKYGLKNQYPCPDPNEIHYPKKSRPKIKIMPNDIRLTLEKYLWDSENTISIGVLFSLYTGMRIGEICGLKWGDLDFGTGTVHISRTVERIAELDPSTGAKTKIIIGEPKTENSVRTIPLPAFFADYLHLRASDMNNYIITNCDRPTEPHSFYMRYKTLLRKCGIEGYTFHALRHTFATRCVECGFDAKSLSEIIGHASTTTTLQVYVHPTLEQKRAQMERLSPDGNSWSRPLSNPGEIRVIQKKKM